MSDNNYYIKYIAKNRNARINRERLKNKVERRNPYMFNGDGTLNSEDVVWYQFEEREIIDYLTEDDENLVSDSDKSGSLTKHHIQSKSRKQCNKYDEYKKEVTIGPQNQKIPMYELEDYENNTSKEEKYRNSANNSQEKTILKSIEHLHSNKYSSKNNYNDQDKDKDVSIFQLPFPEDNADFQQKSSDTNNKDKSRIIHRRKRKKKRASSVVVKIINDENNLNSKISSKSDAENILNKRKTTNSNLSSATNEINEKYFFSSNSYNYYSMSSDSL